MHLLLRVLLCRFIINKYKPNPETKYPGNKLIVRKVANHTMCIYYNTNSNFYKTVCHNYNQIQKLIFLIPNS